MLKLKKKPCHIGNSMSTNTEKHGEEDVGAIDLKLDGIVLDRKELEVLLGPNSHGAVYRIPEGTDGKDAMPEIRFPFLQPLAFNDHFEGATVELELGMDSEKFTLSDCKVRSIKLQPQAGGLTLMSCSIRSTPDSDTVAVLYNHLNTQGMVKIDKGKQAEPGKRKQNDLPLGEGEDDGKDGDAE